MLSRFFQSGSLALLPYPAGKGFGFTIIDDTDGATLENVRPVYDMLTELGLRTTKTVWAQRHRLAPTRPCDEGDTLERPEYTAWLLELKSQGFEIALHNVSSGDNTRGEIAGGIERFRSTVGEYPAINVHHEKNRENVYFGFAQSGAHLPPTFRSAAFRRLRGLVARSSAPPRQSFCSGEDGGSPHFWGDICRSRIRYVRSNVFFADLNTLQHSPHTPYTSTETPYVNRWFDSSNGQDVSTFHAILNERNIDRLVSRGGCCILYTHFGMGFVAPGRRGPELNSLTRERLAPVAARRDGWFVPVSTMLDRLAAMQNVLMCHVAGGIAVVNRNPYPVESLTLQGSPNQVWRDLSGNCFRTGVTGRFVFPVLPAGASTIFLPGDTNFKACRWNDERGPSWLLDAHKAWSRVRERMASHRDERQPQPRPLSE